MRTKAERQGPKKAGPVLSVLLMLLLLLMAAVVTLSYPFFAPFVAYRRWQTRQFVKRMAAANRVMERPCFALALEEKRGTVIEEWVPFKVGAGPLRRWWTADDVRNVSPYSPPEDGAGAIREKKFSPFNDWCREEYTGIRGRALLVEDEEGRPLDMEAEFPIPVVATTFHKG